MAEPVAAPGSVLLRTPALARALCVALGEEDDLRLRETVDHFVVSLDPVLELGRPRLLADLLDWLEVRLPSLAPEVDLDLFLEVLAATLPSYADAAVPASFQGLLAEVAALRHAPTEDGRGATHTADVAPSGEVLAYVEHILSGRRDDAVAMVVGAVERGREVGEVLLELLQPALHEIGRRWQCGRVTLAQEHLASAVTQLVMALLYPRLTGAASSRPAGRPTSGRRLVATCVGDEDHQIGLRMVVDLLVHAGWRASFLGARASAREVVDEVAGRQAQLLVVSATLTRSVPAVRSLVSAVRSDPHSRDVRILVGGRPFLLVPELAREVGADAWAPDARTAVDICDLLVS